MLTDYVLREHPTMGAFLFLFSFTKTFEIAIFAEIFNPFI